MENGMETTRARFTRRRRQWTVTINFLSQGDMLKLENFVSLTVNYGANIFYFTDTRDPYRLQVYTVRFSKLPEYEDADWVADSFRQNCTFELREV